jgi:surface protein
MFYNCYGLTGLNLSSFDTSKVTDMSNMFYNANGLKIIYASGSFVGATNSPNMFS